MSVRLVVTAAVSALALATASLVSHAADAPDFDYFKAKVQPILLAKRAGHARCVMCHAEANNAAAKKDWEKRNAATCLGWRGLWCEPKDLCSEDMVACIDHALEWSE